MAMFSNRRKRPLRVSTTRGSMSLADRLDDLLQNQSRLLRSAVCVLGMLGMLFAVEAWRAPFPYRLGDRPQHGLSAKISFKREDRASTERARDERERLVPYYFRHDATPLGSLPARFRVHLGQVAQASDLSKLSAEATTAFGLDVAPDAIASEQENKANVFATLKSAVATGGSSVGNRIDELAADFEQFIEILNDYGVVPPEELTRNSIPPEASIAILVSEDRPPRTTIISELLISELVKDTGQLGKSWNLFPRLSQIQPMLQTWLISQTPGTLRFDPEYTLTVRQGVREGIVEYDTYEKGMKLVEPNQFIDETALDILLAEYSEVERLVSDRERLARVLIVIVLLSVLGVLFGYYVVRYEPQLAASAQRIGVYLAAMVVSVGLARVLSYDPWRAEIIPILCTTMVIAIAYNQVLATLSAFAMILVTTLSTVVNLSEFVVMMSVASASVIPLSSVASRSSIIKVGFLTAIAYFVVAVGHGIVRNQDLSMVWQDPYLLLPALKGAGWCLVAGYLVAGSLPFIESAFGFVTDISLLELSDVSHPLLQQLVRNAPGTYNHSIAVATIGEAAADRIGANGLLVRVAAYYHDVGKMLKPQYFIENMTEENRSRHESLAPAMSTLIIIGHVKDGADLARNHNLPQPLIDFIEQHHGTTLVEYFYRAATRKAEIEPGHRTDAEESSFRYPGPKPQSREAGVMMLADAVESASRTLSEPTPKRIESLVHEITMKRLLDGQFDESSLTLTEIRSVEDSLIKSLTGIYHGRIKYPEQRTA